jgi:uncharacterized protein YecE (DUF72 family)
MARVLVGTSGWHYDSWRGPFFPPGLPLKRQLSYYAGQFETTELNSVFYRTPTSLAVKTWRNQTGTDFVFSWKASKFITHWKRLSGDSKSSLHLLESKLRLLGKKAGPVLFQLPPNFKQDAPRLEAFFRLLPPHRLYCFEFRHPSWYIAKIYLLLSTHNVALCISDHGDAPAPWKRTADFVYVRGHGPTGRYKGSYPPAMLSAWALQIQRWKTRGWDVYVYFDNDQKSAATTDALWLRRRLGQLV